MSTSSPPDHPSGRVLCLGEARVDLIAERRLEAISEAESFVPHAGGAMANVAVVAARAGARVSLAGGAGADEWGVWLREHLEREGVEVSRFGLIEGKRTLLALVHVDPHGEPRYELYGDAFGTVVQALGERVDSAVKECAALVIGSGTLVDPEEREVTMRAREAALGLGRPVVFHANLRLHRWRSRADATASSNACVPRGMLVSATAAEAAWLTGEEDPEAAASALLKAGARLVVITLGPTGAILRGEFRADVPGVPARVLTTLGAGEVLAGTLIARLAASDFYPPSVAVGLSDAAAEAARACARWGAVD